MHKLQVFEQFKIQFFLEQEEHSTTQAEHI